MIRAITRAFSRPQVLACTTLSEVLPLDLLGISDETRARDMLASVGLQGHWDRFPEQLSGGEQQMLAIGRALMSNPKFLMLDEPSLGIAPRLISTIFEKIVEINKNHGITVLLVEQNANLALEVSSYAYCLETGRIAMEGESKKLRADPQLTATYLGG